MLRPILALNLPETIRTKLQSIGYEYIEDIEAVLPNLEKAPHQLKAIILEQKIAAKINWANKSSDIISAASLWHFEFSNPPVTVFHEGLHKLLEGGLPIGRITELCGPPGAGKTQMCLQFCVDVQMPRFLGGSCATALYISTDFGFRIERFRQIIKAGIDHCSSYEITNEDDKKFLNNFTMDHFLNGVSVLQVHEIGKLIQAIKNLRCFFEDNKGIKLLVVDSFSLPLVTGVEDLVLRSKVISEILEILLEYAVEYKFAIVLTNQLNTIITATGKILKPSLGEGFGHRLHQRLILDNGKVYLTKSINRQQLFTQFQITKDGIR